MTMQHLLLPTQNKDTSIITSMHNALITLGFVQTADTGQMNPASPGAWSASSGNLYGYTVYKFNDSAQSTFPIYFKIKWQNHATANTSSLDIILSVGTATDGAGTITSASGTTVSNYNVVIDTTINSLGAGTTASASTLFDVWINSDGSHLTWMYVPLNSGANFWGWFTIDRFRNADGTANTRGFHFATSTATTSVTYKAWNSTSTAFQSFGQLPVLIPWFTATTTLDSTSIPIFPCYVLSPKVERCLSVVAMNNFDIGMGETFQATHLGSTHTFMSWGASKLTGTANFAGTSQSGNSTLALLNE